MPYFKLKAASYLLASKDWLQGCWLGITLMGLTPTRISSLARPRYTNYVDIANNHVIPSLGNVPIQALRTSAIQELYNQKSTSGRLDGRGGLSPRIIHLIHQVVNGALKQAVRERIIPFNPAEHTSKPGLKYKEMQPLTVGEVNKYLQTAKDDRLYPAFLLELTSGLRRSELLAITWDNVDFANGELTIKKSLARIRYVDEGFSRLEATDTKTESSKRTIPLLPEVALELKKHKIRQAEERLFFGQAYQNKNLVFATETGRPIEPRNFHRRHTVILRKAGIRHVRLHDLRHTFATILIQEGE